MDDPGIPGGGMWMQRSRNKDAHGATWKGGPKTGTNGGVLLVAYAPQGVKGDRILITLTIEHTLRKILVL